MCILSSLCEMFVTCMYPWFMLPWFLFAFVVLNRFGLAWLFVYEYVSLVAWFCYVFRDDSCTVSFGLEQYLSEILAPVMKSSLACPCLSSSGVTFRSELAHHVCVVVAALFNYATPRKLQGMPTTVTSFHQNLEFLSRFRTRPEVLWFSKPHKAGSADAPWNTVEIGNFGKIKSHQIEDAIKHWIGGRSVLLPMVDSFSDRYCVIFSSKMQAEEATPFLFSICSFIISVFSTLINGDCFSTSQTPRP